MQNEKLTISIDFQILSGFWNEGQEMCIEQASYG